MRTDGTLTDASFRRSPEWKKDAVRGAEMPEIDARLAGDSLRDGKLVVHSLSGHERNRTFLNLGAGREFVAVSALSGLDNPADSRCFALFDYDRDGWQDIALVNANNPLTNLYRNEMAEAGATGGMIALRFVGGNQSAAPSAFACRDGYGAMVEVDLGDGRKLAREHRCGEGYAAQNSATMIVGIGGIPSVASVTVRWPSGRSSKLENVAEGTLVTAYENRPDAPFIQAPYRIERKSGPRRVAVADRPAFPLTAPGGGEGLRVYTTTATWCAACINHLPALAALREAGIDVIGIPIDADDTPAKLDSYKEKWHPAYTVATVDAAQWDAVAEFLAGQLKLQAAPLPTSVVTDAEGGVLAIIPGVPTLSALRKLEPES